jgi:enamine deaminase RidA (YjgF/YER057c/UK114 family)
MTDTIAARLQRLGHQLPEASGPAANYVPVTRIGALARTTVGVASLLRGAAVEVEAIVELRE